MPQAAISFVLASAAVLCGCGCRGGGPSTTHAIKPDPVTVPSDDKPMQPDDDLQAIRNDRIQFATMRPPDSTMPTRDRQVKVIAPPEAVTLAARGDLAILDKLIPLLADPTRAWAAEVMLAAMTGHEADLVNDYQSSPDEFYADMGAGAKERWQQWLDGVRSKLQWDATRGRFVVK